MWNLISKIITKQNGNRIIDTENGVSCQRGEGAGGWVKKGEGIVVFRHRKQYGVIQKERWVGEYGSG